MSQVIHYLAISAKEKHQSIMPWVQKLKAQGWVFRGETYFNKTTVLAH